MNLKNIAYTTVAAAFVLAVFAFGCMTIYNAGYRTGFDRANQLSAEEYKFAANRIEFFTTVLNDAGGRFANTDTLAPKTGLYYEPAGRYQPHAMVALYNREDTQTPLVRYIYEGDAIRVNYYADHLGKQVLNTKVIKVGIP